MTTLEPLTISPALSKTFDAIRAAGLPVLLEGSHGIGKSQFLEAYARERGLVPYVLDLSLLEATDLTGIPYVREGRTHFAPPVTLPPTEAERPALLVLEELNRCDRSVRQPCLQLLTTRRLNGYALPPGCALAACVNPDGEGYEVDALDPALASRFVRLRVEPDPAAWVEWARGARLHPGVVRFVEAFPQAFDRAPPRTWEQAARLIDSAQGQGWSTAELEPLLAPVLQPMTARALVMELPNTEAPLTAQELLEDPTRQIPRFEGWVAEGRLDAIHVVLDGVGRLLKRGRVQLSPAQVEGLQRVLDLSPADLALPVLETLEAVA